MYDYSIPFESVPFSWNDHQLLEVPPVKKFIICLIGAISLIVGSWVWLIDNNEALSTLPFGIAVMCLVAQSAMLSPPTPWDRIGRVTWILTPWIVGIVVTVWLIYAFGSPTKQFLDEHAPWFLTVFGVVSAVMVGCGITCAAIIFHKKE